MCEEDLKTFDPKLNNENLIKSLQTLKQFYADLQLKEVRHTTCTLLMKGPFVVKENSFLCSSCGQCTFKT